MYIHKTEIGGACGAYGEGRGVYRVLVGKPEGKRPLGRPRRRWEDNIMTDPQEVGCGGMDWIELAQDRDRLRALVKAVMNLNEPHSMDSVRHEVPAPSYVNLHQNADSHLVSHDSRPTPHTQTALYGTCFHIFCRRLPQPLGEFQQSCTCREEHNLAGTVRHKLQDGGRVGGREGETEREREREEKENIYCTTQ